MPAVDFHAHAFPDELASRAISRIEGLSRITSVLDGNFSSLVSSMDAAGIEQSVILSIATKPAQLSSILAWFRKIASKRIIPFLSVSPADPQAREHVRLAAEEGFRGLKFHPYYQDARRLILCFPPDKVPFGSDSPWADQGRSLALLKSLSLDASREEAMLSRKARALLDGPRPRAGAHT